MAPTTRPVHRNLRAAFPYGAARRSIEVALAEDLADRGDVTLNALAPSRDPRRSVRAHLHLEAPAVIAGLPAFELAFHVHSQIHGPPSGPNRSSLTWKWEVQEGSRVPRGMTIGWIEGPVDTLLAAERTALNFLMHLSGVATLTSRYVAAVADTRARILCTRKTVPTIRSLQKYAVTVGGDINHRHGLHDAILIKENHIAAVGGIRQALHSAEKNAAPIVPVVVEVESLQQLDVALACSATWILLDNFTIADLAIAVKRTAGRARLEASGGIDLDRVVDVARTGVDWISVGALTHSAPASKFSLSLCETD